MINIGENHLLLYDKNDIIKLRVESKTIGM